MNEKGKIIYRGEAPNGEIVKVEYYPKAFSGTGLKDNNGDEFSYRADHFVFKGRVTSETGYKSHFAMVEYDYAPTKNEMIEYIKECIEEYSGMKYCEATQQGLI